jgi:excisionase family DNA binding protein
MTAFSLSALVFPVLLDWSDIFEEPCVSPDSRPPNPRFLTVAEVAYLTRLSKATVYRLAQAQKISALRFGRSYRVTEAAVDEFIARAGLAEDEP